MARIRIYIARHLCTAPRPQKEATALAAAGHEVSIHGIAYRRDFAARDRDLAAGQAWRWEPVADFSRRTVTFAWWWARLLHRRAKQAYTRRGAISAPLWSVGNERLRCHAHTHPADLMIAHAEGSLWFARELQQSGVRVGVDFEDWFSEDLTSAQRRGRPVEALRELERHFLQTTPYALTTSHALAGAMARAYDGVAPAVIYNTFPESIPPPPPLPVDGRPVRITWFSLVLGPERGLEALIAALPALGGDWELHLRGEANPAYVAALLDPLPRLLRDRVHLLPTVPARQLADVLATSDIGAALDVSTISSRNLTITNKLFHYLQSGLAVVASDTAGHREVIAGHADCGTIFPAGNSAALAAALNSWLKDPAALLRARRAARTAYLTRFAHEQQQHRYAELAGQALSPSA